MDEDPLELQEQSDDSCQGSGDAATGLVECKICLKSFSSKCNLTHHVKHHHIVEEAEIVCSECGKEFKRHDLLHNHIRNIHEGNRPFKCATCSATFALKGNFHQHEQKCEKKLLKKAEQKVCHGNKGLKGDAATEVGDEVHHICTECGSKFSTNSNLRRHLRNMHPAQAASNVCPQCGKTFKRPELLQNHVKNIHSNHRVFRCFRCSSTFALENNLRRHELRCLVKTQPEEGEVQADGGIVLYVHGKPLAPSGEPSHSEDLSTDDDTEEDFGVENDPRTGDRSGMNAATTGTAFPGITDAGLDLAEANFSGTGAGLELAGAMSSGTEVFRLNLSGTEEPGANTTGARKSVRSSGPFAAGMDLERKMNSGMDVGGMCNMGTDCAETSFIPTGMGVTGSDISEMESSTDTQGMLVLEKKVLQELCSIGHSLVVSSASNIAASLIDSFLKKDKLADRIIIQQMRVSEMRCNQCGSSLAWFCGSCCTQSQTQQQVQQTAVNLNREKRDSRKSQLQQSTTAPKQKQMRRHKRQPRKKMKRNNVDYDQNVNKPHTQLEYDLSDGESGGAFSNDDLIDDLKDKEFVPRSRRAETADESPQKKRKTRRDKGVKPAHSPHQCHVCAQNFASEKKLAFHVEKVHCSVKNIKVVPSLTDSSKKALQCSDCQQCFLTKKNLMRHMRNIHDPKFNAMAANKLQEENVGSVSETLIRKNDTPCVDISSGSTNYVNASSSVTVMSDYDDDIGDISRDESDDITDEDVGVKNVTHIRKKIVLKIETDGEYKTGLATDMGTFSKQRAAKKQTTICPVCNKVLPLQLDFVYHMKSEHGVSKPFQCPSCERCFSHSTNLSRHVREQHRREGRKGQQKTDNKPSAPKECKDCGRGFKFQSSLEHHMRLVHQGQVTLYRCEQCGQGLRSPKTLALHIEKRHTNTTPPMCTQCGKQFSCQTGLNKHMREVHQKIRPHQCSICHMRFYASYSLQNHMRTHTGARPWMCDLCGKSFGCISNLNTHRKIHTAVPQFPCPQCNKMFRTKSYLNTHLKFSHAKERNFMCSQCPKSFCRQELLTRHMLVHSGEKKYVCEYCSKAFALPHTLDDHRKHHFNQKPHVCNICQKGFTIRREMRRHKKLVHGIVEPTPTPHNAQNAHQASVSALNLLPAYSAF